MVGNIFTSRGIIKIDIPDSGSGEHYMVCPICSMSRKTNHQNEKKFAINISSPKLPWRCNHCGEGGYVLDDDAISRMKIKPLAHMPNTVDISPKLREWFANRGLSDTTLDYFRISMSTEMVLVIKSKNPDDKGKYLSRKCANFKYFWNNSLINIKFRDNEKNFKMISDASMIFYNIDSIKGQDYAIITEGEIDAMSYHEAGVTSVVSVPNGASMSQKEQKHFLETGKVMSDKPLNLEYVDNCLSEFENVKIIYIATDSDGPGIKLREELARRFGRHRCKYIEFSKWKDKEGKPIKDANQMLVELGKVALKSTLSNASDYPVEGVIRASDVWPEIDYEYDNGRKRGIPTGYKTLDAHLTLVPGWLSIVNGFPSEGKSTFMFNIIAISTVIHKFKWALYAPENYPIKNIYNTMAEIILGENVDSKFGSRASKEKLKKAVLDHLENYIYFIDNPKGFTPAALRDKNGEMIYKYGIHGCYEDPWRNLKHVKRGMTIDEYLEDQLAEEVRFAISTNTMRFITHHPPTPERSKDGKTRVPTAFELHGGTIWFGMAYQIICVSKQNREDPKNTMVEIHIQKVKDHKMAGVPTYTRPVLMRFKRINNRFYECIDAEKDTLPEKFVHYPIKDIFDDKQLLIDDF